MTDHLDYMRNFILLAENLQDSDGDSAVLVESAPTDSTSSILVSDLEDLSLRMRSVMETSDDDYANGFDDGMQRAADMLENLIKRSTEGKERLG